MFVPGELRVNEDSLNDAWGIVTKTSSSGNGYQSLDNQRDFGANEFRVRMRCAGTPVLALAINEGNFQIPLVAGTGSRLGQFNSLGDLSASIAASSLRRALSANVSAVGNVGAGEDDLMTYSVAGGALAVAGDAVSVLCAGRFAAATVRLRAYFGSDLIFDSGAVVAASVADWTLRADILRDSGTTQKAVVQFASSSAALPVAVDYTTPGRTLSGANTFKLTAEATSNDDVVQELMKVFIDPAA